MKIKLIFTGVFFLIISNLFAQTNLNSYKYVIVPNKFDFLKEKNQYQLNGLAQFLFKKYGFTALMEGDDYPEDLLNNRCLALRSDVLKESGMFKTKLQVQLKDCNDKVVYTSAMGESREKEYKKAYNLALRQAFGYLEGLNYSYVPDDNIIGLSSGTRTQANAGNNEKVSKEIEELKAEIENLKKEKVKAKEPKVLVAEQKPEPVKEVVPEKEIEPIKETEKSKVLYAQEIENGFQLVDNTPKVVYRVKKTGLDNVFLVEGKSAILYKKESDWVLEFYVNGKAQKEIVKVKF
ncbi:hypothetical protein [Seonamhaeicola marinus]|uniref:Secreted protein n=1 Tax=Seonamhaeicola marinus TaxID=1912246 RepID=A0A5D0HEM4_9FLAO|nr:hypothetical protein [Seonamhaeicola marinus]TYA69793.1 hypothetical protein FUA24_21085 [Seonamhaeicola marinus]